ncbi:mannosyltransferase [Knufia obscura]|uniref:Mannosyltransferase n=2 Tax=Knufia TaxID=430999 RepID=A0AAN8EPN0_9EURO|nr:mannosyltransferase [Knufia obscura]KAK5951301.1 mannosyltransferase [Knufia fluminis]
MLKWKPTRRKRRQYALIGAAAFIFIFILTVHHHGTINPPGSHNAPAVYERAYNPLVPEHARFWKSLYGLILNNNPQCLKRPDLVVPRNPDIAYDPDYSHPRPDVLWMDEADISRMKAAHSNFITDIRSLPTNLVYNPGTRGIVTTASEGLLAILSISLRMLRKTGTNLPVEIFLNRPTPFTNAFCTNVFPHLDAKCLYLSDIFSASDTTVNLNTYQYKVFSILFSSFEDVLLLDSDAWPISNPEPLFHSLPFSDTGLILWPDFWYASESPYFFDIAKIAHPPPLTERPATESGEMLYSKAKHGLGIMLAVYYNYYGPEYFYLLQSQDGPGQGDKETFPWAAAALGEDFYFVHHPVGSLGRHDSNGEYIGTAMIQYDPVQDFFALSQRSFRPPAVNPEEIAHPDPSVQKPAGTERVKPLFVHANFPKFDPITIFDDEIKGVHTPTRDSNGDWVRCWMPEADAVELFGFDLERRFWEAMEEGACGDLLGLWVAGGRPERYALEQVRRRDQATCDKVRRYYGEVFGKGKE